MAKPSLMDWLLDPTSSEEDYQELRRLKKDRERAASLQDMMGGGGAPGVEATNLSDLEIYQGMDIDKTPVMTDPVQGQDASGMYVGASAEEAQTLDQIKRFAGSTDPDVRQMAITQLDEMMAPPPKATVPTLMALHDGAKADGYTGNLQSFVKDYNLWSAGEDPGRVDPAYASQFELTSGDPMTDQTPTVINQLVKSGAAKMRPSAAEQVIQEQGEQVTGVIDSVFETFLGKDGDSGLISGYSPTPSGMSPLETLTHRFKTVGEEGWDTWINQNPDKVTWNTQRSLISRQLGRKLFSEKGAGSDKDAGASEEFFPILPGSEVGFGDSKEVMIAKLEGLAEIYNFLAPSMAGGRKANYDRYLDIMDHHRGKIKEAQDTERKFYLDNGEIDRIQNKIDKGETPTTAEMRIWALDTVETGKLR